MDPIAFGRITAPALIPSPRIHSDASPGANLSSGLSPGAADSPSDAKSSFADLLGEAVARVQQVQGEAEKEVHKLLAGEPVELHRVMLAGEQAGLASEMMMAVRNKVVDAYQEIMRMQV